MEAQCTAQHYARSITLGGEIGVNFYVVMKDCSAFPEGAYMQFTVEGAEDTRKLQNM